MNRIFTAFIAGLLFVATAWAGNPDRQGEAGAYELLLNPWARSAGLHTMTTANIWGVEAMRLNVAGLARLNQTEVLIGHSIYLQETGIRMNALGVGQRVGENGVFGISLMSMDFGDIDVTSTQQPEGSGATFSPNFFHLGFAYSHRFANKVSVGILFRGISESTTNVSAFGLGIDAGVQYEAGDFKFGISLRNVGSRMQFKGEGLVLQAPNPDSDGEYQIAVNQRTASFELPSMLNLGLAYDFRIASMHRITLVGNFTSNSFSQDQIGGGVEYSLNEMFAVRGGYKYEFGSTSNGGAQGPLYTGVSAGASLEVPFSKEKKNSRFGIDYAYRPTKLFGGTHNISVRVQL